MRCAECIYTPWSVLCSKQKAAAADSCSFVKKADRPYDMSRESY